MPHGSCLCTRVTFSVEGTPSRMYHCHCSTCRAASGASFVTNVVWDANSLRFITGAWDIGHHESSPGKMRFFCNACGSPLYSRSQATADFVSVRSGVLQGDPGVRPQYHQFVGSKAPWVVIDDGLPAYAEGFVPHADTPLAG